MSTDYKNRLQIPIEGNPDTVFTTKSGFLVAKGYARIVIGKRGPYVEFVPEQFLNDSTHIPDDQMYRLDDKRVYYLEFRTVDSCNVKVYFQRRTVVYADYKIGYAYISPFDLLADGKVIIEKLKGEKT